MKLEEIEKLWAEDVVLNRNDLSEEALRIPKLHQKYYSIYVAEALKLKKLDADLKVLKLQKHEFYTQGPSKEQVAAGWKLPPVGRILKSDVQMYIDADPDIINKTLNMALAKEKVDFLDSIIRSLRDRGYLIKNAIEFEKFRSGG